MASTRLSDVIEEHLFAEATDGRAPGTLRGRRATLLRLLAVTGNIYVKNLEPHHVDRLLVELAKTRAVQTRNIDIAHLSAFFKWCRFRRYLPLHSNPLGDRKYQKHLATVKRRISMTDFPQLLDAAEHPRDRIAVALGLYLFLRASEITTLTMADVHLDRGEIDVTVWKTKQRDVMPICEELDIELRRWLTRYTEQVGELPDDYLLVPAKYVVPYRQDPVTRRLVRAEGVVKYKPTRQVNNPERIVQRALELMGHSTRDAEGKSLRDGIHTLRRSGARALFDQLRSEGYDGALQRVRAMLHHEDGSMTEKYLGINVEYEQRNELLRGRRMYSLRADNVVELRKVSSGGVAGDGSGV